MADDELVINVTAKDTASSVLAGIDAQLDKTSASADRAGAAIGDKFGAGAGRATNSALSLQQAQARLEVQQAGLARAQGDGAKAAELMASAEARLTNALAQTNATTTQTISAERQLASVQTSIAKETQGATGATGGLGGALGNLVPLAGAVGGAFAAIGTVQKVVEFANLGESINRTGTSFERLAQQAGTTGEALLTALRAASGGEISDLNLELAANRAQLLGVANNAQQFGVLMNIARARAADMGITTTQAFGDLITGLGRASPMILDNLGITVKAAEADKVYAASIGKAASELTDAEKKQALINAVIAQGQASMAGASGQVDEYAGAWARAGAGLENLKNKLATMTASGLAPAATGFARLTEGSAGLDQALAGLSNSIQQGNNNTAYLAAFLGITATNADFARQQIANLTGATDSGSVSAGTWATTQQQAASAAQVAADAIATDAAAIAESADKSVVDTANKAAQTAQTQLLSAQAQAAAQAFLALNPNIDAAGIAALVAAGKISPLIGQLAAAAQQANIARAALIAFNNAQAVAGAQAKINADRMAGTTGRGASSDAVEMQSAVKRASDNATAAQRAQTLAVGTTADKVRVLRSEYDAAAKSYGGNSAEAIKAQTALMQATDKGAKAGGGGGGGGGAKLSDQQKLNSSLLSDQQAAAQKSEDAEKQHNQRLLDIQRQYNEKMKAAEQSFQQSQLDGRAGFYDKLGQIKDPKLQQQLAAQYEQASAEAATIAQQKGADVAEKYLAAQEQVLSARAGRIAEIQKAIQEGDKGRAEYLKGVDALYREGEQRKIDTIKAGGGSIAAERDKALADEGAKYADGQDKIALAADRAADRKIAAAERSGKKIDEEQLKVDTLAASYDRIAPGGGAPTPAAVGTPPITTPAAATGGTQDPIVAALSSAQAAIVAALGAVESATKNGAQKVAGAVGNLAGAVR